MNHLILNDPGTKIDARPLIAAEALRGALVGLCWSLAVGVPVVWLSWIELGIGPYWGMALLGAICSIWTAIAAFAERWRTPVETFTGEQWAVFLRYVRFARILGGCGMAIAFVAFLALATTSEHIARWLPHWILTALAIRAGSSVLGRIEGQSAVRAMQRTARDAACRIDARPLAVASDALASTLVQRSKYRVTESPHQVAETNRAADGRLED